MHHDGNGWVTDHQGHQHWGRFGAAGLLVTDDDAATTASFARVGAAADRAGWDALNARTARAAQALWPTVTEPLLSREQARQRRGAHEARAR